MTLTHVLLIALLLLMVAANPSWAYSRSWGYWPSSGLGLAVLLIVFLMLLGRW